MDNNPKISVIIPVFNVEQYLRDCLDSIIRQTYRNTEILCIDNGSTDKSAEILNEYSLKDNRIVILQSPKGVSRARNLGIDNASGEYITFVDSDDVIDKEYIERLYKTANGNNVDFVVCSYNRFVSNEKFCPKITNDNTIVLEDMLCLICNNKYKLPIGALSKLYRRKSIKKLRFLENMVMGEDKIFTLQYIIENKRGAFLPQELYGYRTRENSATTQNSIKKHLEGIKCEIYLLNYVLNNIDDINLREKMIKFSINEIYAFAITRPYKDLGYDKYLDNLSLTYQEVGELLVNKKYFKCLRLKKRIFASLFVMNKFKLLRFVMKLCHL
jgi:glycosyltransferase involved in cell wall biosynthesis